MCEELPLDFLKHDWAPLLDVIAKCLELSTFTSTAASQCVSYFMEAATIGSDSTTFQEAMGAHIDMLNNGKPVQFP